MFHFNEDDPAQLALHILQALVISVMTWVLVIRFLAWADSQPVVVEQDIPTPIYLEN